MFRWRKGKSESAPDAAAQAAPDSEGVDDQAGEASGGFFSRLRAGLSRTRSSFAASIGNLLLGEKEIGPEALDELETALLVADVGVDATRRIMDALTARVKRRELANPEALFRALGDELAALASRPHRAFAIPPGGSRPHVILVVGVNGAGKTTTIGKLARRLKGEGRSVLLAAGDTFRAAAVEQLVAWGARNDVPVIAQAQGADTASVIFDALQAARARGIDVVLADTAGRLQSKANLMEELAKVRRVIGRFDPTAPHEVLLVLDAGVGQNALSQARQFLETAGVTGLVLTKLDGTARGGVVFAVIEATGLPVYFVGVGEGIDDLRPFDPEAFVAALLESAEEPR